jgi:hypothetical protein
MGIRTRLIAATMAVATLTAVVGVAAASAAPASPTASAAKQPAPGDKKEPAKEDKKVTLAKVAKSLHVSVNQLETALDHLKLALSKGVDKATAIAAFAKELKVSVADAEKALRAFGGGDKKPGPGVPADAVTLLAAELHISTDRARTVFTDLDKVKGNGEEIVKEPAFIAIAKGLGITPQRLLDALITVKKALADKEGKGEKAPSGTPTK